MSLKSNKSILEGYDGGYDSGIDKKSSSEIMPNYSRERPKSNLLKATRSAADIEMVDSFVDMVDEG